MIAEKCYTYEWLIYLIGRSKSNPEVVSLISRRVDGETGNRQCARNLKYD